VSFTRINPQSFHQLVAKRIFRMDRKSTRGMLAVTMASDYAGERGGCQLRLKHGNSFRASGEGRTDNNTTMNE